MTRKGLGAGVAVFLALVACGVSFAAPTATRCRTRGLASAHRKPHLTVTSLTARRVSCAKAARVAAEVVKSLASGKGVSLSGTTGMSMTQTSANGVSSTHLTLTYPHGASISLALKGNAKSTFPGGATPFPSFPNLPNLPFPSLPNVPNPGPSSSAGGTIV